MTKWPVLAYIDKLNGSSGEYERTARHARLAEAPPSGMLCHMAGSTPEAWHTISIYESRSDAEAFFAGTLGAALVKTAAEAGLEGDVTYSIVPVFSFAMAPAAVDLVGARLGAAATTVAFIVASPTITAELHHEVCDEIGFWEDMPEGLLWHVATSLDGEWQMCDVWQSLDHARGHYRRLLTGSGKGDDSDPPDAARTRVTEVDIHTLLVAPGALNALSRFDAPIDRWREISRSIQPVPDRDAAGTTEDREALTQLLTR